MAAVTRWVRENAQNYLLRDAQARVARAQAVAPPQALGSFFWSHVFVPAYRRTPWPVRRRLMAAMPGSHRRRWPQPTRPSGPAV